MSLGVTAARPMEAVPPDAQVLQTQAGWRCILHGIPLHPNYSSQQQGKPKRTNSVAERESHPAEALQQPRKKSPKDGSGQRLSGAIRQDGICALRQRLIWSFQRVRRGQKEVNVVYGNGRARTALHKDIFGRRLAWQQHRCTSVTSKRVLSMSSVMAAPP